MPGLRGRTPHSSIKFAGTIFQPDRAKSPRYQGSPDGQKWMLTKYMGEDAEGDARFGAYPSSVLSSRGALSSSGLEENRAAICSLAVDTAG